MQSQFSIMPFRDSGHMGGPWSNHHGLVLKPMQNNLRLLWWSLYDLNRSIKLNEMSNVIIFKKNMSLDSLFISLDSHFEVPVDALHVFTT